MVPCPPPTVSVKAAERSALVPWALSVMAYVPAGVLAEVATVTVDDCPAVIVCGANVTVTPEGAPEADSVIGCAAPELTCVASVAVARCPACTDADDGLTETVKSSAGGGVSPTASFHSA